MTVPAIVGELVERFDSHKEAYRSGQYNEAQLREEFLNPFFEALGWDIYNKRGYAEAYKEVVHEAAIKSRRVRACTHAKRRIGQGRSKGFARANLTVLSSGGARFGEVFWGIGERVRASTHPTNW